MLPKHLILLLTSISAVAANSCSERCSNNALCCCCSTSHKLPGGSGWIQTIWTSQPRCMGQNCDNICNDWTVSSKNTCPKFNDPAGYQPCATVSPPANSANSNFVFYGNGNLAGGWTWESDTTKGVVITSNGLITWQRNNINTVCIRQKNNKGTTCYRRPAYAACLLNPGDIDNAWGFP
ncbi:hypothetical protein ColLi_11229 [Colletotrichum liriopes]|uniref:Secreted protein n=1 Tax=Colletotrichum liriopes TaxID=708192 RepID=A0AA37LY78_9PEZI|nr:hypothetical protein ColLi_11229 [Colletotrichum liriopes]